MIRIENVAGSDKRRISLVRTRVIGRQYNHVVSRYRQLPPGFRNQNCGFERFSGLQSNVTQFVFDDLFRHFLLSTSIESEITGITTA